MSSRRKRKPSATITRKCDMQERQCAASGRRMAIGSMVRFVLSPSGSIVPDIGCKLPGRGVWVQAERNLIEQAVRLRIFENRLKRSVAVPANLTELVETRLAEHIVGILSMTRKSRCAICGYTALIERIGNGHIGAILIASDASGRQSGTILRKCNGLEPIRCLTSTELGVAFGREKIVYAGIERGGLAKRIVAEAARLSRLRA